MACQGKYRANKEIIKRKSINLCILLEIALITAILSQEAEFFLNEEHDCQAVQAFQPGRNYYYHYEGIVDYQSSDSEMSGFKIKCTRVVINVLSSCAARMKMEGCMLMNKRNLRYYWKRGSSKGYLDYDYREVFVGSSHKFAHHFHRFPVYFFFNSGEVTKIFMHSDENDDVANMKKAILSAISLKFFGQGYQEANSTPFNIPGKTIFGSGDALAAISNRPGSGLDINITRHFSSQSLPGNIDDNLRMMFDESNYFQQSSDDFFDFIKRQMKQLLYKYFGNSDPTQICSYTIKRGRLVTRVTCKETHSVPWFVKWFGSVDMQQAEEFMSMNVSINLRLTRISSANLNNRISTREYQNLKTYYHEENLYFKSNLNKVRQKLLKNFKPLNAFLELLNEPVVDSAPIFPKVVMWMLGKNEEELNNLYSSVKATLIDQNELQRNARELWLNILVSCTKFEHCQDGNDCTISDGCQNALAAALAEIDEENIDDVTLKYYFLEVISSMKYPNFAILQTALNFASSQLSPESILSLGKVLVRHSNFTSNSEFIADSFEFLQNIIKQNCRQASSNLNKELLVQRSIASIANFVEDNEDLLEQVEACMDIPHVPSRVLVAAIQAINNPRTSALPRIRRKLMDYFLDRNLESGTRMASFLVLLLHEPSQEEVTSLVATGNHPNETKQIQSFVGSYLRSALLLRGTHNGTLTKQTAEKIFSSILELGLNEYFPSREDQTRVDVKEKILPLVLPHITLPVSFKQKVYFSGSNIAPFLFELDLKAKFDEGDVPIFDLKVDIGKVTAIFQPLVGKEGLLPEDFLQHMLQTPVYQWAVSLNINSPRMSAQSLETLRLIIDQYRTVQTFDDIHQQPIFDVRFFGKSFSLEKLYAMVAEKQSLAALVSEFIQFEQGLKFDFNLLQSPFHFKSQIPTSLGLPLLTNIEFTKLVKADVYVKIPFRELFFTKMGNITFTFELQDNMFMVLERVVQPPIGNITGCGSLFQLTYKVDLPINVNMETRKVSGTIGSASDVAKFQYKSQKLSRPWSTSSGFQTISSVSSMSVSSSNPSLSFLTSSYGDMIVPRTTTYSLHIFSYPYKFLVTWGLQAIEHRDNWTPAYLVNVTGFDFDAPSSLILQYIPRYNIIAVEVLKKPGKISFQLGFDSGISQINRIFTSFNVTMLNTPIIISYFSIKKIFPSTNDRSALEDKATSLGLLNELKKGSGLGFDVNGNVTVMNVNYTYMSFIIEGHLPKPTSDGEWTAFGKVYSEVRPDEYFVAIHEKSNFNENNQTLTKVNITFKRLSSFISLDTISLQMTWNNETGKGYHKVLRIEADSGGIFNPFLDMRQSAKFFSNDPSIYDWNATITLPFIQGQWRADARDESNFFIQSRVVVPVDNIPLSRVKAVAYEEIKLALDYPSRESYGLDISLGTLPANHVNATVFRMKNQNKEYVHLSKKTIGCRYCIYFNTETNFINGQIDFKFKPDILKSVVFFNLRPSLVQSLNFFNTTLLVSSGEKNNSEITLGHEIDVKIFSDKLQVVGSAQVGNTHCKMRAKIDWFSETNTMDLYNSNLESDCGRLVGNATTMDHELNFACTFKILDESSVKTRHIECSNSYQFKNHMGINEVVSANEKISDNRLQKLSLNVTKSYNLTKTDENNAITEKTALSSLLLSRIDYSIYNSSYPAFLLNATTLIPYIKNQQGGGNFVFNHSGVYFLPAFSQENESSCLSRQSCSDKFQSLMQSNVEDSLENFNRRFNFMQTEMEAFSNYPWKQSRELLASNINESLYKYAPLKEIESHCKEPFRKLREMKGEELLLLFEKNNIEDALLKMKEYFKKISDIPTPQTQSSLTNFKIYIESYFKSIYEVNYAVASILSNPLNAPQQIGRLITYLPTFFENQQIYKTFGFSYPDMTQFISINNHYHFFPSFPSPDCMWLGSADTKDQVLTVIFKESGLVMNFLDETLAHLRNGSFAFTDFNHQTSVLEYPFITKKYHCSRISDHFVECSNFFSHLTFEFDPESNSISYYVETIDKTVSSQLKGLCGTATSQQTPNRLLPDEHIAKDEAEFLNRFELTKDLQCQFLTQNFFLEVDGIAEDICNFAFSSLPLPASHVEEKQAFLQACYHKATTVSSTCMYTNLYVNSLRRSNVPAKSDPNCLTCSEGDGDFFDLRRSSKSNLLFVISLAERSDGEEIKSKLITVVREYFQRMAAYDFDELSVTILTYGGLMNLYAPAINTVHGLVSSSDENLIQQRILNLRFDGPRYDSGTTIRAFEHVAHYIEGADNGRIVNVVAMAPETGTNNIKIRTPPGLPQALLDKFITVFFYGSSDTPVCNTTGLPEITEGTCYSLNEYRGLIEDIVTITGKRLRTSVYCRCKEDPLSGEITSRCYDSSTSKHLES